MFRSLVLLAVLFVCGCGGSSRPGRVAVQGSILSAEGFVANGTIRFLPQEGTSGPVAITTITNGLYHFTANDGPYPGPHKVLVNLEMGHDELSKLSASGSDVPQMKWEDQTVVPTGTKAVLHFEWNSSQGKTTHRPVMRVMLCDRETEVRVADFECDLAT